jgi:hypothetical protein
VTSRSASTIFSPCAVNWRAAMISRCVTRKSRANAVLAAYWVVAKVARSLTTVGTGFQCGSRQPCSELSCEPRWSNRDRPVSLLVVGRHSDAPRIPQLSKSRARVRTAACR